MASESYFFTKQKIFIGAVLLFLGFVFGIQISQRGQNMLVFPWQSKEKKIAETLEKTVVQVVSEESQVIDVVKKSTPTVVSIAASADVPKIERCYKELDEVDPFFDDFFSFRVPSYCERGTEKKRVGAGTGFLVSSDGYIVTNKHVVANVKAEYTVFLNDPKHKGEKISARVLAKDPANDIAVLKIDLKDLPYLEFGDSEILQVGQSAIAVGYALGEFENTVSKGVVSGLARSITASDSPYGRAEQLEGIIQTDAAINPGNSGGPLLDISGKVIGMNVAMAQAQSIGFAIPSNDVKKVFEDVKKSGKISRAFLGVRYMVIDEELQKKNNLPYSYGALIIRGQDRTELAVVPGSPADIAGIVENDVILEINGVKITSDISLSREIAKHRAGDAVTLKVYHKGKEELKRVVLEERGE